MSVYDEFTSNVLAYTHHFEQEALLGSTPCNLQFGLSTTPFYLCTLQLCYIQVMLLLGSSYSVHAKISAVASKCNVDVWQ